MADNNPSLQDAQFPDWQPQFRAALLETDPQKLQERCLKAEEAIFLRMQALTDAPDRAEMRAIEDAAHALRVIQVQKLNFPDWTK